MYSMKVAIYGQTYQDNAIEYLVELLDELPLLICSLALVGTAQS